LCSAFSLLIFYDYAYENIANANKVVGYAIFTNRYLLSRASKKVEKRCLRYLKELTANNVLSLGQTVNAFQAY